MYQGLSGQMGDMPQDLWLRKQEVTNMDEDPMILENHLRNLLVDHRPDRPFLESDEIRGANRPGSGFMSTQMLNLRHSMALTPTSPHLGDNVFLDHVFLERDPRSTSGEPDFQEYAKQSYARGSFHRYYDDSDNSIQEDMINPVQMVANKTATFYPTKDRMNIFDESYDAWGLASATPRVKFESARAATTTDGTILDLTDTSYVNRRDAVTQLSNDPMIGWRYTEQDQRVKVNRYGNTRASQTLNTQDWNANRASAYVSHDLGKMIDKERVTSEVALAIANLAGIRDTKQAMYYGTQYNDSEVVQILQTKVPVDTLNEILKYAENSAADPSNIKFEGTYIARSADRQQHLRDTFGKSDFNHEIIESMSRVNGKLKERDISDLRDEVIQSAESDNLYHEDSNRKFTSKSDRRGQIDAFQDHDRAIEESRSIKNYKNMTPQKENRMQNSQYEAYKKSSKDFANRKARAIENTSQKVKNYGQTVLYKEGAMPFVQAHGSMTDKYANRKEYYNGLESELNERQINQLQGSRNSDD